MTYTLVTAQLRRISLVCFAVTISLMATACHRRVLSSPSASTPKATVSAPSVLAVDLPCPNGQIRNKWGDCPNTPTCPLRCILGGRVEDKKSCWNHEDYAAQRTPDGKMCAWTYPPVKPDWLKKIP